jgi:hypothetical protein
MDVDDHCWGQTGKLLTVFCKHGARRLPYIVFNSRRTTTEGQDLYTVFNAVDRADIPRIRAHYASLPTLGAPVEEGFDLADEGEEERIHLLLKVWSVRVLLRTMEAKRAKKLLRCVIKYAMDAKTQELIDIISDAITFIEAEDAAGAMN